MLEALSSNMGAIDWPVGADAKVRQQFVTKGEAAASQALFEAGIPGIKFFDNTSRNTADGKLIDVSEADDGFRAKVAVDNRAGGLGGSGRIVTTSPPYKTKQEALDWADKSIGKKSSNYVIFDDSMIKICLLYTSDAADE